jgi:prevent-host-death family protein
MTATEASRSFAAVLDSAEHGETIVVTRGGRRIAVISPAPASNGFALNDVLSRLQPDEDFAADIRAVRELLDDEAATWPDA